jgi:CxxC-x17-CxxC domain-containing protein
MGSFNRGGNRRSFGNNRDRGGRRERPEMHQAICAECGKKCEVPFRPTGDKPVYCSNCFEKQSGENRFNKRSSDRHSNRPNFGDKRMYKVICDKCHKECEVPFKPSSDKPVYCDDCFGKNEKFKDQKNEDQFEILNVKLDKILKLLLPNEEKLSEKKVEKKIIDLKKPVENKKNKVEKKVVAKKPVKKVIIKKKKK